MTDLTDILNNFLTLSIYNISIYNNFLSNTLKICLVKYWHATPNDTRRTNSGVIFSHQFEKIDKINASIKYKNNSATNIFLYKTSSPLDVKLYIPSGMQSVTRGSIIKPVLKYISNVENAYQALLNPLRGNA